MNLWDRLAWAKENLEPFNSDYRIVWENPEDIESPVRISIPDSNWMSAALFGGILPPVEVYRKLETNSHGKIINGEMLHKETIGPLSEEEAIEYLVQKDIPECIWNSKNSNRQYFYICKKDKIPTNRKFRNAWRLNNGEN